MRRRGEKKLTRKNGKAWGHGKHKASWVHTERPDKGGRKPKSRTT